MSVPLIGGQHGVVFFGPRSNPRRDRYWAERGLIHREDSLDGSYETLTVKEFLLRLKGINDMLGNSKSALQGFAHFDEIQRQQNFIEEAAELVRKAKEQQQPPSLGGRLTREHVGSLLAGGGVHFSF